MRKQVDLVQDGTEFMDVPLSHAIEWHATTDKDILLVLGTKADGPPEMFVLEPEVLRDSIAQLLNELEGVLGTSIEDWVWFREGHYIPPSPEDDDA